MEQMTYFFIVISPVSCCYFIFCCHKWFNSSKSVRRKARLQQCPSVPSRNQKKTSLKLLRNISFQDHVAMLGDDDGDTSHQRKKLRMEIKDHLNVGGVCGNILRSMKIPLKGDEEYEWHFLHPCAFLSEACKLCPLLGDMVKGNGGPRVVIYMDEIKPGNVF